MKVTFVEALESHLTINYDKICTCGSHRYYTVEQLEPVVKCKWSIRCCRCDRETPQYANPDAAMIAWENMHE